MVYRVILVGNNEYKKTIARATTRETVFKHYHRLKEENKKVLFPKRFVNTKKIKPIKYRLCVTKPLEPSDVPKTMRDDFGKTYLQPPIGDWYIIDSTEYEIEETFWIYGMNSMKERPTIKHIIKLLMRFAYKKDMVKQIIVVHNKFIIYNEDQFDIVICKCRDDAQRLHHTLAKIASRQNLKNLMFMGTATGIVQSMFYQKIQEKTGWPIHKVRLRTTRP